MCRAGDGQTEEILGAGGMEHSPYSWWWSELLTARLV